MSAFDYLNPTDRKGRLVKRPKEKDNDIARFIRESRASNGWDQRTLSEKSGVGLAALRDIEQGRLTGKISTIQKILDLFNYTLVPAPKAPCTESDEP